MISIFFPRLLLWQQDKGTAVNPRLSKDASVTALLNPGFSWHFKSNFGRALRVPALLKRLMQLRAGVWQCNCNWERHRRRSVSPRDRGSPRPRGTEGAHPCPALPCSAHSRVYASHPPASNPRLTSFRFPPSFQGCQHELLSLVTTEVLLDLSKTFQDLWDGMQVSGVSRVRQHMNVAVSG